jgi:hypothetical protein
MRGAPGPLMIEREVGSADGFLEDARDQAKEEVERDRRVKEARPPLGLEYRVDTLRENVIGDHVAGEALLRLLNVRAHEGWGRSGELSSRRSRAASDRAGPEPPDRVRAIRWLTAKVRVPPTRAAGSRARGGFRHFRVATGVPIAASMADEPAGRRPATLDLPTLATVAVGLLMAMFGFGLLAVMWIPSMPYHKEEPSESLLTTVAQVDVGLLIAMAVEGRTRNFREKVARSGVIATAVSLALAVAALALSPGTWQRSNAAFAVAGTFAGVAYLLARLVGAGARTWFQMEGPAELEFVSILRQHAEAWPWSRETRPIDTGGWVRPGYVIVYADRCDRAKKVITGCFRVDYDYERKRVEGARIWPEDVERGRVVELDQPDGGERPKSLAAMGSPRKCADAAALWFRSQLFDDGS